jgi:hypothetical protein
VRTLLYTAYDDGYRELGDLTAGRMHQYASRHGWDFRCYRQPLLDIPLGIYWSQIIGCLRNLEERRYERVIWLDCDQVVTNMDFELPELPHGINVSRDWGTDATEPWQFSVCGIVADGDAIYPLREASGLYQDYKDKPFPGQAPLQEVKRNTIHPIHVQPRRLLNAVPTFVMPTAPEPWQPGDWCAHLTNVPVNERMVHYRRIMAESVWTAYP